MVGGGSGQQASGDPAAEEPAAPGQRERPPVGDREPESRKAVELALVEHRLEPRELERLVEPEPEHQPLGRPGGGGKLLHLTRWSVAATEYGDVPRERRGVPPAPVLDCADRSHTDAEV